MSEPPSDASAALMSIPPPLVVGAVDSARKQGWHGVKSPKACCRHDKTTAALLRLRETSTSASSSVRGRRGMAHTMHARSGDRVGATRLEAKLRRGGSVASGVASKFRLASAYDPRSYDGM